MSYEEYGEVLEDKVGVFVVRYVKIEDEWGSFCRWIEMVLKMRDYFCDCDECRFWNSVRRV